MRYLRTLCEIEGFKFLGGAISLVGSVVGGAACIAGTAGIGTAGCVATGLAVGGNGVLLMGESVSGSINGENVNVKGEILKSLGASDALADLGSGAIDLITGFGAGSGLNTLSSVNAFTTSTRGYYTIGALSTGSLTIGGISTYNTIQKCTQLNTACDYNDYYNLTMGVGSVGTGLVGLNYSYNGLNKSLNAPVELTINASPKPSPNFQSPTNSPQSPNIPKGYIPESIPNNNGIIYRSPGTTGNANTIRVMNPTQQYPKGYWVKYNEYAQPIDISTGQPGMRASTHIPLP